MRVQHWYVHFNPLCAMFGNLGFGELMVILVIVLVLFGAKRVPEISASFGKGIREFKRNLNDVEVSVLNPPASRPLDSTPYSSTAPMVQHDDESRPGPKRLL